jgi:hypothetical protein
MMKARKEEYADGFSYHSMHMTSRSEMSEYSYCVSSLSFLMSRKYHLLDELHCEDVDDCEDPDES